MQVYKMCIDSGSVTELLVAMDPVAWLDDDNVTVCSDSLSTVGSTEAIQPEASW